MLKTLTNTLINLFFLILISLLNLIIWLVLLCLFTYALAQGWLLVTTHTLHVSELADFRLAGQGFLTYGIFLLLIVSNLHDFTKNSTKIRYSRYFLNCFASPEHAVRFWLNLRFYLGLAAGFIFVAYSV